MRLWWQQGPEKAQPSAFEVLEQLLIIVKDIDLLSKI